MDAILQRELKAEGSRVDSLIQMNVRVLELAIKDLRAQSEKQAKQIRELQKTVSYQRQRQQVNRKRERMLAIAGNIRKK
jgi:hypothetical protein